MTDLATHIDAIAAEVLDAQLPLTTACGVIEARIIEAALERAGHSFTRAAVLLGVHRNTLYNKTRPPMSAHDKSLRRELTTTQRRADAIRAEIATRAKRKSK